LQIENGLYTFKPPNPENMFSVLKKLNSLFKQSPSAVQAMPAAEEAVSDEIFNNYSFIISARIRYFNELPAELKLKFISRVYNYIKGKQFHYIGLEHKEEIPILVGASAAQVTLGLRNYQMLHFKNIYVLADAYRMDNDEELYIGHVAPDGIYLSWKHFLYGYSNNNDNINMAVHEMSHALLFNNFFAQYGIDKNFRLNYEKFSNTTGPILADVITRRKSYLRSYAFSNIHEFWAVSVEAFFENPAGLKENMPQLYNALCRVLNQDPVSQNKILNPELC
jgi:Mlc titration factor MtfA (ptsG expression regulator)